MVRGPVGGDRVAMELQLAPALWPDGGHRVRLDAIDEARVATEPLGGLLAAAPAGSVGTHAERDEPEGER